jgi:hypothetical protein
MEGLAAAMLAKGLAGCDGVDNVCGCKRHERGRKTGKSLVAGLAPANV